MMQPGKRFYSRPSGAAAIVVVMAALLIVPTAIALTPRGNPPGNLESDKAAAEAPDETGNAGDTRGETSAPPERRDAVSREKLNGILDAMLHHDTAVMPMAMHVDIEMWSLNAEGQWQHNEIYSFEQRLDGRRVDSIMTRYRIEDGQPRHVQDNRRVFTGDQFVYRQQQAGAPQSRMHASLYPPEEAKRVMAYYHLWGGVLLGYLRGDQRPIAAMLKDSADVTLHERTENVDGAACYVIEGRTNHGTCQLWVDPEHGYRIRRSIVDKGPGDMYFGKPMSVEAGENRWTTVSTHMEISDVTLEKIGDHFIPTAETMTGTTVTTDGTEYRSKMIVKRSDIDLRPDFETLGAFVMDGIPDGTRLSCFDPNSHTYAYEWRDGKAVSIAPRGGIVRGRVRFTGHADLSTVLTGKRRFGARFKPMPTSEQEGKQQENHSVDMSLEKDGSFYVEDIPAGQYRLHVSLTEPKLVEGPSGNLRPYIMEIAGVDRELSILEKSDRAEPQTVDLGVLEMAVKETTEPPGRAPQQSSRTEPEKGRRGKTLRFPGDRSVGQIQVREAGASRELTWFVHWTGIKGPPWEDFCDARGDVRIPAGKHVALTVNRHALRDLSWLGQLGPDDLYSLSLPALPTDPAKASDACMPLVARLTGLRSLSLYQTGITNSGLRHITKLRSLEYLDAPSRMTDRGLAYVAELPSLKGLYIGGGSASMMTDAGLRHLAKLTSLEELYLAGKRMGDAGLAHIAGLPRLEYLSLYGSRFTNRGMAHVKQIPSLRILSFHEGTCRITDAGLAHIAEMPKLELLLLGVAGPVTDNGIRYLTRMPSLRKLHLDSPLISDRGLEYLGQIRTLEYLALPQDQHGITDAGLMHLGRLANLRRLHISRIHFNDPAMNTEYYTDRGLQALANCRLLEELGVGSPGITDAGLDHIAKLTGLKRLSLFGCDNVTDAGLAKLTALQSLTDLSVTEANVTLSGISQLGSLTHLARLNVSDLRRGGAILDLSDMTNLEHVGLGFAPKSDEAFGDVDLACLANLKTLKWLQIGPRDYTDKGLRHLAGLTNMERLNLGGSGLTDEGLKHLANMKRLDLLSITGPFDGGKRDWSSGGHFTDEALRTLEQFKQLTLLEIYSDNSFSAPAVRRLRAALPNLYSLNLNGGDGTPTGMGARVRATRQPPSAARIRQNRVSPSRRR